MRKTSNALVTYASSSDDDEVEEQPQPKKRKLPSLSASFANPAPIDRPELHQGRIRTQPHVEGQWAAHVYVSLVLQKHSPLNKLVANVVKYAKESTPTLNDFGDGNSSKSRELHISLSRPIYLRAHQREDLKRTVKSLSSRFPSFQVSFATFSELLNDERTRTFLTMDVGAGHQELRALSDALTPALRAIRQKEYYSDPRFHASIAWALLHQHSNGTATNNDTTAAGCPSPDLLSTSNTSESAAQPTFPTIPSLPKGLISSLNSLFSERVSSATIGTYNIDTITVKIGKETHTWCLSGD